MKTLRDFRAQYPKKYAHLSDEELASNVHSKKFPDMPTDQFNQEFGLNPSFIQQVGHFSEDVQNTNIVRGGTSFVDAVGNIPIAIGNTLVSPFTDQRVETHDTQPGEGWSEGIGDAAGNAFGLLATGAGLENIAMKGLNYLSKFSPSAQKILSQLTGATNASTKGGKTAVGAGQAGGRAGLAGTEAALLSPDETMKAAEEAALIQGIFETIHPTLRGAGKSLEAIPAYKYMEDMVKRMQETMNKSEADAGALFNKAEEAGAGKVLNMAPAKSGREAQPSKFDYLTGEFSGATDEVPGTPAQTIRFTEQLAAKPFDFSSQVEETYAAFLENPNYQNAFKLQSDLGLQAREIKSKGAGDAIARKKIEDARKALNKDIETSLLGENSEAAKYLNQAMHKWATDVAPTRSNAKFKNIREGKIGAKGPHVGEGGLGIPNIKQMKSLLEKELGATTKGDNYRFPETHPFHKELSGLNERAELSQLLAANPLAWMPLLIQGTTSGRVDPLSLMNNQKFLEFANQLGEGGLQKGGTAISAGIAGGQ
jgi:hypothetical protein